jgi:hypothetical protein
MIIVLVIGPRWPGLAEIMACMSLKWRLSWLPEMAVVAEGTTVARSAVLPERRFLLLTAVTGKSQLLPGDRPDLPLSGWELFCRLP